MIVTLVSPSRWSSQRWIQSTSNRTFVAWPLVLLGFQALVDRGRPHLTLWALPFLLWGYAQYRLTGSFRTRLGGGGPGMSVPPERLVTSGPYDLIRNPMYLGHLIFFLGLALMFSGAAWLLLVGHVLWFDRRVRADEKHLIALFGQPYRDYMRRTKRWIPMIY